MDRQPTGQDRTPTQRALTIRQPWADLIVGGHKDVENRTWSTTYRGRLWIHAAVKVDDSERATRLAHEHGVTVTAGGRLLGYVTLADVVREHKSVWALDGHYHWVLTDPVRLVEPIPVKGSQGIWKF
jgi:hypothetical protein